jgi:2-keto-4-pentenoate hydratase/2-oxohepta-3-ene-1,7-dioic acid hydratase in catechol pathway
MRLVRFEEGQGRAAFGMVEGSDVFRLIGDPLENPKRGEKVRPLADMKLLAPCVPRKIPAVAINFPGIDRYNPDMKEPLVLLKAGTSVCGPGDPVINPFPELRWWGEAELAVVIRRPMKDVPEERVRDYVLGFTIGNDASVENVDGRDHHLARSKAADSFCPLGPWIDTEFDARDCVIEAVQNGEVIRRGRTTQQVWQWPRILSRLSSWMTLEPWDVVLTGNPPDTVGMRFIEHGDVYTARIEGLGELTNPFYVKGR